MGLNKELSKIIIKKQIWHTETDLLPIIAEVKQTILKKIEEQVINANIAGGIVINKNYINLDDIRKILQ